MLLNTASRTFSLKSNHSQSAKDLWWTSLELGMSDYRYPKEYIHRYKQVFTDVQMYNMYGQDLYVINGWLTTI